MQALDIDYLAFSFHKMLAPFGVDVLYGKEHLLRSARPFLYGGDMIAEGRVFPDRVEYNALPWKYSAGTPNILGVIISAQALRMVVGLVLTPKRPLDAAHRTSLVAFNTASRDPVSMAEDLDLAGVEAREGCHCATLAHHALQLDPPASCRLSFYLYNTPGDIDQAVAAVAAIAAGRSWSVAAGRSGSAQPWYRRLGRQNRAHAHHLP